MILFKPNGSLDIASASTDVQDEDMVRCKNLRVEQNGQVSLRRGSSRITSPAMSSPVFLQVVNGYRISIANSNLMIDESTIRSVTGSEWTGVRYKSFNQTFRELYLTNGTDRLRIDGSGNDTLWGIDAPTTAPTLSATTGAGNKLTGTYNAKYTYLRKDGDLIISESNPSPAGTAVDLNEEQLAITVTAPSDDQVTHIRVYRTLADGELYYYDSEVAYTVTSGTLVRPDSELSTLVEEDHDRPPTGISVLYGPMYNGILFGAVGSQLWWSDPQQPEYWPTTNFVECGGPDEPITTMCGFDGRLYVFSRYSAWYVQGAGSGVFLPVRLPMMAGAIGKFGAVPVVGRGIYHVGVDGIYLFAGGSDKKITDQRLLPIFSSHDMNGIPAVTSLKGSWLMLYRSRIYFHWMDGNVLVLHQDTGRVTYYKYDEALDYPDLDEKFDRILCWDGSGYIRWIERENKTDDQGEVIEWELQSKDFTLQTRAHFPRWAKYDVDATNSLCSEAKAEILLDGTVHQTHQIVSSSTPVASYNRDTKRRLVEIGNGERCAIKLSGTGPTTIYAVEME